MCFQVSRTTLQIFYVYLLSRLTHTFQNKPEGPLSPHYFTDLRHIPNCVNDSITRGAQETLRCILHTKKTQATIHYCEKSKVTTHMRSKPEKIAMIRRRNDISSEIKGIAGPLERFTSFTWADFERGSATWTVSSGGSRQEFLSMLTLAFIAVSSSASRVLRRS